MKRITERLGIMRGQLQAIHLRAHIESARVLTDWQIEACDRLGGYGHRRCGDRRYRVVGGGQASGIPDNPPTTFTGSVFIHRATAFPSFR